MPKDVRVSVVEDRASIDHLKRLLDEELIGVDSEWKPNYDTNI